MPTKRNFGEYESFGCRKRNHFNLNFGFDMKHGWENKTLMDIANVNTGKWDANHAKENGEFRFYTCAYDYLYSDTKRFSGECLILPGNGVNVGEVFYYNGEFDAYQRTYILSEIKISPKYLHYHMLLHWKSLGTKKQYGSATNFIKIGDFKDYTVQYHTLPEQQRIVTILDKVYTAIATAKANAEQNLLNAKELFESYLRGVFENKGEDWRETSLKNEIDLATGFAFKSKNYTSNDDDMLHLRGDNIMQGDLRWKDAKRWDKSEYNDFEKYQLQENDIVLAMDRPWVKAGLKCARVSKSELPSLLVQRTARLRNKPQLDNSFLYYLIQSKGFTDYLIDIQTGIGVPHISGKQIFGFPFRKPNLKEQQQIVKN